MSGLTRSRRSRSTFIRVDRIRCDGYGMCAEMLPEAIELDDWGYPIIRPGPVAPHLEVLARRAVDVCPVLALRLDIEVAAERASLRGDRTARRA